MSQREGLSERQIASKTGLSRNTVAKWLRAPLKEEPRYRRGARAGKLSAFEATAPAAAAATAPAKDAKDAKGGKEGKGKE